MFLRGKHGLALVCAASWAGCSVFSSSSDENTPNQQVDAGVDGLAPVTDANVPQGPLILADGAGNHCAVVRRRDDGTLDPSFGHAGVSSLPIPDCAANALTTTAEGKLLLAGPKTFRVWL